MNIVTVEFGPWEPDAALLNGQQAPEARNVIPMKRGYAPIPTLTPLTPSLGSAALEVFASKAMDDTLVTAAATSSGIRMLEAGAWVTRYSGTPVSDNRYFAQYGDAIYATFGNVLLKQTTPGTAFSAVSGAPTGEILSVIRDFLVLGRVGGTDNEIRWSGIDRPDSWPAPGSNTAQYEQSDNQVFPEGGRVMAIVGGVGGTDGIVFLERAIQRMTYVGTPYIFQFDPIDREFGLRAEKSAVVCGGLCCYLSGDGWRMTDGASVKNIGAERVDDWFFDRCDLSRIGEVKGAHDPQKRLAAWSFPSSAAPAGVHDTLLIYSYALDKWSYSRIKCECVYSDWARGVTLDELDSYGDLDDLPFDSLDSEALKAGGRALGAVTTGHKLGSFSGPVAEAIIDTAEAGGKRMMVHGFRPLVDGGNAEALPIWRILQMNGRQAGEYSQQMRDGVCYQHISCDYVSARVKLPFGEGWTRALGVEALVEEEGGW